MAKHADLPIHFRTGLRAVGIVNGRPVFPICGGDESEDAAAQAAAKVAADAAAAKAAADAEASRDKGFPENTPIEQMKPEQREAYWRDKAQKHEKMLKSERESLGHIRAEELATLREKAKRQDLQELELGTTADKAAAKAAEEATAAARAKNLPILIAAKLDAAAARAGVTEEDLAQRVEFVDTTKFLDTAGEVDTDKVKAFVATIAPAKGNSNNRLGPSPDGLGNRNGSTAGSGADKGRAEAIRRGFIKADA